MTKFYDATKEHAPVVKDATRKGNGHPNKGIKGKNPYSGKTI